ncbi:hypothetical protein BKA81DRAFT_422585 [Phyllosticta paracitricarpa]|uniref:Uncharacterized protein n=1 Tax=Phyllosticta citricarpa TaxID=55181 RepID=A0ABR1LJT0_9PEZI
MARCISQLQAHLLARIHPSSQPTNQEPAAATGSPDHCWTQLDSVVVEEKNHRLVRHPNESSLSASFAWSGTRPSASPSLETLFRGRCVSNNLSLLCIMGTTYPSVDAVFRPRSPATQRHAMPCHALAAAAAAAAAATAANAVRQLQTLTASSSARQSRPSSSPVWSTPSRGAGPREAVTLGPSGPAAPAYAMARLAGRQQP